ncbi:MAG: SDR family oxidoreductase [Alphaproteobacteria bacterium]|nr:SDR family oxidoreductase [Alphaproteobacteria bacterium]
MHMSFQSFDSHNIFPHIREQRGGRRERVAAVTGGAGFIGSHLCEALLKKGRQVVCLDDFSTGAVANIRHLAASPAFTIIPHDIVDAIPDDLPRFDEIYNFACPASPVHYQADRVKTAKTCALGVLNVLERAERDGSTVLQASTSEIYGDPEVHPQAEHYRGCVNPVGPRACYDEGKRFAETLCTDFAAQTGIALKIVRIFNTYGPRMRADDGRVISNFVVQALAGEDLTVYGDGAQTRSFCYVDDLVDGCLRLAASPPDVSGPVNLGNPEEITVLEAAKLVLELTGSGSRIVQRPLPEDDPRRRRPDIARARAALKWRPKVPLREGLVRTIESFARRAAETAVSMPARLSA